MISSVARSGSVAASLTATNQVVASTLRPIITEFVKLVDKVPVQPEREVHRSWSMSTIVPHARMSLKPTAISGIMSTSQVRYAHSDVQFPDYSSYMRESNKDVNKQEAGGHMSRKAFSYLAVGGTSVVTAYGAKNLVTEFLSTMSASADVLAMAKIEVKLSDIPEGKNVTFKWRGKPLFVRHRSAAEIETEQAVDVNSLRDMESDADRVKNPEWLVIIGVCTHLGCVPTSGSGEFGGYYCPCHGSHYDASGRIRKGPAPLNLEVPEYTFLDDNTLLVG